MVTAEEILKDIRTLKDWENALKKVNAKVAQAFRIRMKLMKQRDDALYLYESEPSKKEEALRVLKRCFKNERNLTKIITNGVDVGIGVMKGLKKRMKDLKVKQTLLNDISFLLDILKYSRRKIKKIPSRLEIEEQFLQTEYPKHFKAFRKAWKSEIKYDRKIAIKINPARIDLIAKKSDDEIGKLIIGGIGAMAFGSFMALGTFPMRDPKVAVLCGLVGAILGLVSALCIDIGGFERHIFELEKEAILRVKTIT